MFGLRIGGKYMMSERNLIIYFDYDVEKRFENVREINTHDGTLEFYYWNEFGNQSKAQYDMSKLLGFVYEI